MSTHHQIAPEPENMVWGYFDPALEPILTIASGDTVGLTSWAASTPATLPVDRSLVNPKHLQAMEQLTQGPSSHFMVGPIAVDGAEIGQVLQIDILETTLADDWGYTAVRPLAGTLPYDFEETHIAHSLIDRESKTARLPWGLELALEPFFGIIAVAPPANWGRQSTMMPRKFGGNMDNKELRPGTTLYLPILNDGAMFYAGDGHGIQGDGEVCVTAIETGMNGTFRLSVRADLTYDHPFAENEDFLISIGLDEDLDEAARQATRQMIDHVQRRSNLARHEAYMLCSLAGDLRVTQTVDGVKGIHMMMAKKHLR